MTPHLADAYQIEEDNKRTASSHGLVMEAWTDGRLYNPNCPVKVGIRLKDQGIDRPWDKKAADLELALTMKANPPKENRVVRLDRFKREIANEKQWILIIHDAFSSLAEGDYVLSVSLLIENGNRITVSGIPFQVRDAAY
jgi:hypothetical protein